MKTKIVRKSMGQDHVSLPKKWKSGNKVISSLWSSFTNSMYKNISTHVRPTRPENHEKVENELIFQAGTSCIDSQSVKNSGRSFVLCVYQAATAHHKQTITLHLYTHYV